MAYDSANDQGSFDDEGITKNRRVGFCQSFSNVEDEDYAITASGRGYYYLNCLHEHWDDEDDDHVPCHEYPAVFCAGSPLTSGTGVSDVGIGVALGGFTKLQLAIPIPCEYYDHGIKRTNERAELYAARQAIRLMRGPLSGIGDRPPPFVVLTDSEYVVKGITEWYPAWKENNWRTSSGTTPANLQLFHEIMEAISVYEDKGGKVGFIHITRECNTLADRLARAGKLEG